MNTPQIMPPSLLLFLQVEIPLWLLVGVIILLGSVMCLQLYLAVKKMEQGCLAGENGTREEQPSGLLSGYPVVYLIHSRIKGKSNLEIISYAIIPERERTKGKRVADLLVKIYLKDGTEKWILQHTEIEGGSQHDFAFRIFQYHYRLLDRYHVPVETIAVFTGDRNQHRPSEYSYQGIDTSIRFRYRAYHIFDHGEAELLAMDNPFALVVLACQKSLLEGKIPDSELGEDRLTIAKALLRHRYDHDRIISFLVFLKNFIWLSFQNSCE